MTGGVGTAASRWKGRAWALAALACVTSTRGLRGLSAIFEGMARLIRMGARQLERAAAGARSRANLAPAVDPVRADDHPATPPDPAGASDKTIVAASPFLASGPPALPPPRPQWGRGAVLPPPRRTEWRAALEAKRRTGESAVTPQPAAGDDALSDV